MTTSPMTVSAPGTLIVKDEKLFVEAQYPRGKKQSKSYTVPAKFIPFDHSLDGVPATVTWNSDGYMIDVRAMRQPRGPVAICEPGFLNPYAFVSIPDREPLPTELQDSEPAGHDRYIHNRWTGSIGITITTKTPLLIPETVNKESDALPVRVDPHGRPLLAGSAVKGMLRSAYEMITNSRLSVFTGHDQLLAIRANADTSIGTSLKPAVVTEVDTTHNKITITWVVSFEPHNTKPLGNNPTQPAVWVPRKLFDHEPRKALRHRGCLVEAWVYLAKLGKFPLWRVAECAEPGKLSSEPPVPRLPDKMQPVSSQKLVKIQGRLHWTDSSFPAGGSKKHDERLVVEKILSGEATVNHKSATVSEELIRGWCAVIDSFAEAHKHEEPETRQTRYGSYVTDPDRWKALKIGDTLYVEVDDIGEPVGLFPAMIGRKPFPGAPEVSLPLTHRPATSRKELSPADRVFGWVRQGADDDGVAHRGHLRVLPPYGDAMPLPSRIRRFNKPLRLVPLNGPKPAQFLFYLADDNGKPLNGKPKKPEEGYPATENTRRLRGRKVYLTHAEVLSGSDGAHEYWDPDRGSATDKVTVNGKVRYREYLGVNTDKNVSSKDNDTDRVSTFIQEWVKPETTFQVTLMVDNLNDTELGALLWLLTLPENAMLKLGLGKPLGFGAVRVELDEADTCLYNGDSLHSRYTQLSLKPKAVSIDEIKNLREKYDNILDGHLSDIREEFLNAAWGFTKSPVHYPRLTQERLTEKGEAKIYEWFVENDRSGAGGGKRLALKTLTDPNSMVLPYTPSQKTSDTTKTTKPTKNNNNNRKDSSSRKKRSR